MLRAVIVAIWSAAAGFGGFAHHNAQAQTISESYLLPELFDIMAEEGRDATLNDPAVPHTGTGRAGWEMEVARIYDPDRMHDAFATALDDGLDPDVRAEALAFAQSDLGRRVLQLEVSARRALLTQEIDDTAQADLERARSAPVDSAQGRALELVRDRIAANDLIDLNVSLGLNTSLAYYTGMAEAGWMAGMAGADMLALVWAQEDAIRSDVTDWAEAYFLFAYQPLTSEEMAAYLEHARSPAGHAFNRAMFRAFDTVFVDISRRVGAAMARRMMQDTL